MGIDTTVPTPVGVTATVFDSRELGYTRPTVHPHTHTSLSSFMTLSRVDPKIGRTRLIKVLGNM